MMIKIVLVLAAHLAVLAVEVPHIVRHRLRREWVLVLALTALNVLATLVVTFRVPVPGPGRWLEYLFRPVGLLLGG
ncbi:MAG TPA: hypothetical protein VNT75_25940 [Symbiobacteriaceae bacterium]|nr:hypothetical protein [Symbiobacteriaceae bacterium]